MGGGALTKEAKEMFLKKDIEEHRQRTLDIFSTEKYKKARKEQEKQVEVENQ
jgi:hypothetical protein